MQGGILALAAWAAWSGPLQAPLFNPEARAAQPPGGADPGDWRFGDLRAQTVPKLYHLHAANAWLDATVAAGDDAARQVASDAAAAHARTMLSFSPANGYGWVALAWAAERRGGRAEAKALLALSRAWSPHSRDMALARVMLEMRWWEDLGLARREALLDELMLARWVPERRTAMERSPRLGAIWSLARARARAREAATQ